MLVAHQARVKPNGVAKRQWIDVVFGAIILKQAAHSGKYRFCVKPIAVELACVSDDDLVREHGPQHMEVDRNREMPTIDNPRVHIEVGQHAHHLLLEPEKSAAAFVLDTRAGFFVGSDSGENTARVAIP